MSSKGIAKAILGAPPWDEEKMTRAYLADFLGVFVQFTPILGYKTHAELEELMLSSRIFGRSVSELTEAVHSFELYGAAPGFRVGSRIRKFLLFL